VDVGPHDLQASIVGMGLEMPCSTRAEVVEDRHSFDGFRAEEAVHDVASDEPSATDDEPPSVDHDRRLRGESLDISSRGSRVMDASASST
jgi:hypothetical protein